MKYSGINYESIVDGEGVRITIYFSGCNHKCPGCHNPESWDFDNGKDFDEKTLDHIKEHAKLPYISGVTISGGDLLCNKDDDEIFNTIFHIATALPEGKTIWLYTGYTFEELKNKIYLNLIDVLVDGPFIGSKYDPTLLWKGSSNQRIIDVKKSLKKKKIILYNKED